MPKFSEGRGYEPAYDLNLPIQVVRAIENEDRVAVREYYGVGRRNIERIMNFLDQGEDVQE